jgi:hypothetical protein
MVSKALRVFFCDSALETHKGPPYIFYDNALETHKIEPK